DLARSAVLDCLAAFPSIRFRVTGDCMRPTLPAGATVTVASAARVRPRLGDIVLVELPEGLRLHRLIWGPPVARGSAWRTKGDEAWSWDTRTPPEAVLGTVIACESGDPRRGRIRRTVRSLLGGLLCRLRLALAGAGRR
ncbi:MAG: S24/S26 family peptidase, partial [Candidatus Methylomirabilota bacterium]